MRGGLVTGGLLLLVVAGLVLALCSCGGGGDGVDGLGECPPSPDQQASTGALVLFTTCAGCHHSRLEGEARRGAPPGQDFDQSEVIQAMAGDIYRVARAGAMPPPVASDVPALTEAQIEGLRVYLACGVE
jgi:mono/diheme cytochrome c family protein